MIRFRLALALTASCLSAYSPVTWAAMDLSQKSQWNQAMKKSFSGTYEDFYRKNAWAYDDQSRGVVEAWLEENGKTKLPTPQAQIIKDKNGNETINFIFTQAGKTLTFAFNPKNPNEFQLNGSKVQMTEARHLPFLVETMAEKDSNYKELAKDLRKQKNLKANRSDLPSLTQFSKLPPLQRVGLLSNMRLVLEAAQKVMEEKYPVKKTAQSPAVPWLIEAAWAQSVVQGDSCVVAGHISNYETCPSTGRLCCRPLPVGNYPGKIPHNETFHGLCDSSSGGDTACNPLFYGSRGETPICLKSNEQPEFTEKATQMCGEQSPLDGVEGSPERLASYRRILESYYKIKNRNNSNAAEHLRDCFNAENKVNPNCANLFQDHMIAFANYRKQALEVCMPIIRREKGAGDQPKACKDLLARNLDMLKYMQLSELTPGVVSKSPVAHVNAEDDMCKNAGGKWDVDQWDCFCPDYSAALFKDSTFSCPEKPKPVAKKDKCEKKDGSKKNTIRCNPGAWIAGGLIAGALAWLFLRDNDHKSKPKPTVPTPTTPITTIPVTTLPKSEGGTGTNTPGAGGVKQPGTQ
ncbi:MAG: hypothetical protein ACAH59_00945 [Pseudobdellovibrionaceae bacterium]